MCAIGGGPSGWAGAIGGGPKLCGGVMGGGLNA